MKSSIKSLVALLAITTIAGNIHARHRDFDTSNLVKVKVKNDIRSVGRIYVQVKSAYHKTRRYAVWGVKSAHIKFVEFGVNKICAYTSKRNPTERFIYQLTLQEGIHHCVKLEEDKLVYTYSDNNDLEQQVAVEAIRQELINGEWHKV